MTAMDALGGMRVNQLNLICRDPDTTKVFYEHLGFTFRRISPSQFNPAYLSVAPQGVAVALHPTDFAGWWMGHRNLDIHAGGGVIDLDLATPAEVDQVVTRLREAGYRVGKEPQDMEWGQRYAIVLDPDGRQIGLKAPAS